MKKGHKKRDYRLFLKDILDSMEEVEKFTCNMSFEEFKKARQTVLAIERLLGIIGEATRNVPDTVKLRHRNVPWKRLAQLRNFVFHVYWGINIGILWRTVKEELPAVKPAVTEMVKNETQP